MSSFVYSDKPIELVAGDGPFLYDDKGSEYLDMGASFACVPLGHNHDIVTEAIKEQISRLIFVQASFPVETRSKLYDALAGAAPEDLDNVWLCNSGTEANEAALKFARSATNNTKIVATMQGFHGRTMGALSTTWKEKYKSGYEPLLADIEFVPYNDCGAMKEAVDDETAAVIVEPIQGEGGIHQASPEFLQIMREMTEKHSAALVFDEVQTGLGRTGELWACERVDVVPDLLTTAKGLGNGLPIGATLCRNWIAENYGNHSSTFSGSPIPAAAAEATISHIIQNELAASAAELGSYIRSQLRSEISEDVREIRGQGLMIGLEIGRSAHKILRNLATEHQVLALPAGRSVVRLLPPLIIDKNHADRVVDAMSGSIRSFHRS